MNQFDGRFEGFIETRDKSIAEPEKLGGKEFFSFILAELPTGNILGDPELAFQFLAFVGRVSLFELGDTTFRTNTLQGRKRAGDGFVVVGPGLLHDLFSKGRDLLHESLTIKLAVFHLVKFGFPVSRHGGRGQGLDIHFFQ